MTDRDALLQICGSLGLTEIGPREPLGDDDGEYLVVDLGNGMSRIELGEAPWGIWGKAWFEFDADGKATGYGIHE